MADTLRDEAITAVRELRSMGIRTILLTGDREEAAAAVGRQLGVDEARGAMLPDQKREHVKALTDAGRRVAMVGDGINDAPALAAATVGVAMGSGTDVTRESAQVVLIGNDLERFVDTVRISRRTGATIRQNVVGTFVIDTLGMILAGFGLLGPVLAAVIYVVSELTFIANSARLLPAAGRLGKPGKR